MQKLFDDCYGLDARCYEAFGLTEDILMEHAAAGLAGAVRRRLPAGSHLFIVAGPGNNGADGITLARQLWGEYEISLWLPYGAKSSMAKLQLARFEKVGGECVGGAVRQADGIVDALFGAGFSRGLDEEGQKIIEALNLMGGDKIACDIPSGLDPDGTPLPVAFRADLTVTMGALKKALFSDAAKRHTGEIVVADLGIPRHLYESHTESFVLESADFAPPLRHDPAAHKGHFGHLAVVAGQKAGAAKLCALAALRFGAGLVTLVHSSQMEGVPFSLMQGCDFPANTTAVALGMGLGEGGEERIDAALKLGVPLLLDADACDAPWLAEALKGPCVVTPHPAEFARMAKRLGLGTPDTAAVQADRFGWARRFADAYPEAVLVLKGAHTLIAHRHLLYVNPLGTPVLSQAGSGDVLAGLIGSLLAQGYDPLNTAIQGSLALALTARRYEGADYSATAEDLIEGLRWIGQ